MNKFKISQIQFQAKATPNDNANLLEKFFLKAQKFKPDLIDHELEVADKYLSWGWKKKIHNVEPIACQIPFKKENIKKNDNIVNIILRTVGCYANNLSTQYHNSGSAQQPENVDGSFGIEKDEVYKQIESNQDNNNNLPNECYPKDILSPSELLPKDTNSVWAQSVPSGQGSLGDQNFLNAGFHVGMNTVGQTLRNPNYQLRSEPPNPQVKVSPWMQSTIEPDSNRKAMEIGG